MKKEAIGLTLASFNERITLTVNPLIIKNKMDELDNVGRLRDAASTLVMFFDEVIAVAKKRKVAGKDDEKVKKEFDAMVDKINPTVEPYSEVHNELACAMGIPLKRAQKQRTMPTILRNVSTETLQAEVTTFPSHREETHATLNFLMTSGRKLRVVFG